MFLSYEAAVEALVLLSKFRDISALGPIEEHPLGTVPIAVSQVDVFDRCSVEVYRSKEEVLRALVRIVMLASREAVERRGRFVLVLPGGRSLAGLGSLLRREFPHLPYDAWAVFQTDEHAVPSADPENNYRFLWEEGGFGELVGSGLLPRHNLHCLGSSADARRQPSRDELESHVRLYEEQFCLASGDSRSADVVVLGIGEKDGHVASILPEFENWRNPLLDSSLLFSAVEYPKGYGLRAPLRASATPRLIREARKVVAVAHGNAKAPVIRDLLSIAPDLNVMPATMLRLVRSNLLVDAAAASRMARPRRLPVG